MWLQAQDIILRARHIPRCLNVRADRLSRPSQPISTEWSLHSEIVDRIFQFWGTPDVDMFATVHNTRLLQFMSPIPEPQALAVDALSQDWQGRSMYVSTISSAQQGHSETTQAAEVIMIAPWWPSQPWFPHFDSVWVTHYSFHTAEIYCLSRVRDSPRTESRTICTHGASHAILPNSRISSGGL